MAEKDAIVEGLDEAQVTTTESKKVKKEQTVEERETLVAGVGQMKAMGVSENLAKVLAIVPDWNGDKELNAANKAALIEAFGGSDKLKDYIDGEFVAEIQAWQGIAKALPVLNNIKSFYARRESTGTKRVKTTQVSIDHVLYTVNADYKESIAALAPAEKKELLLAHKDTKKVETEEIL